MIDIIKKKTYEFLTALISKYQVFTGIFKIERKYLKSLFSTGREGACESKGFYHISVGGSHIIDQIQEYGYKYFNDHTNKLL